MNSNVWSEPTLSLCEEFSDLLQQFQPTCEFTADSKQQETQSSNNRCVVTEPSAEPALQTSAEKVCCSHYSLFTLIFVLFSLIWHLMCLCNDVVYYTSVRPSVRTAGTLNLRFIPFPLLKDFVSPEQTKCKDLTEIFNLGKVFRLPWKELVWYG